MQQRTAKLATTSSERRTTNQRRSRRLAFVLLFPLNGQPIIPFIELCGPFRDLSTSFWQLYEDDASKNWSSQICTLLCCNVKQTKTNFPRFPVQVVCLGEAPPTSDLVAGDKEVHGFAGEGDKRDGRDAASSSSSADVAVAIAPSEQKDADVLETTPGFKDLDGSFDREAIDALCRQAGSDFFLYGTPHRNISTPA